MVVDKVQVNSVHASVQYNTSTSHLLFTDVTMLLHYKDLVLQLVWNTACMNWRDVCELNEILPERMVYDIHYLFFDRKRNIHLLWLDTH